MSVQDRVASLLGIAEARLADRDAAAAIAGLRARLHAPLRVAICGRVKAGKSTLLNALVGERLAPTDAGEQTRVVTWYEYNDGYSVRAIDASGAARDVRFSRDDGRLVVRAEEMPAGGGNLRVGWPAARLRGSTLIDTPGLGSLSPGVSERTTAALHGDDTSLGVADAVIYLMRHLHPTDVEFLEAFLAEESGAPTPVNSVAVLSRADEIGGGRIDAMESATRIAAAYGRDERVRSLASAVVAVSGLLAETAVTLQEAEATALRHVCGEDSRVVDRMLLSADLWREPGVGPLSVDIRNDLLGRLGMFGLRIAVSGVRSGEWSTAAELSRVLLSRSGLPELDDVLQRRFAGRARQLVARSVLLGLRSLVGRLPQSDETTHVLRAIEETEAATHEFAELRALDVVWSRQAEVSDEEAAEIELVTGSGSPAVRLGLAADAEPGAQREKAAAGVARWRVRAADARSDPLVALCAETIARSYEGLFAEVVKS